MIVSGTDGRGDAVCIDLSQVACVITEATCTYTPQTYKVYLKSGVVLNVDLGEGSSLFSSFNDYLKGRDGV